MYKAVLHWGLFLQYTFSSNIIYGDIINWNLATWEVSNMEEYQTNYSNICKPTALGVILVPGEFEFQTGERLCRQMRGQMNVISDEYNQKFLWEQQFKSKKCSNLICEYIPFS